MKSTICSGVHEEKQWLIYCLQFHHEYRHAWGYQQIVSKDSAVIVYCKTIMSHLFLCSSWFSPSFSSLLSGIGEFWLRTDLLTGCTGQLFLFTILCGIPVSANIRDVSLSLVFLSLWPQLPFFSSFYPTGFECGA